MFKFFPAPSCYYERPLPVDAQGENIEKSLDFDISASIPKIAYNNTVL